MCGCGGKQHQKKYLQDSEEALNFKTKVGARMKESRTVNDNDLEVQFNCQSSILQPSIHDRVIGCQATYDVGIIIMMFYFHLPYFPSFTFHISHFNQYLLTSMLADKRQNLSIIKFTFFRQSLVTKNIITKSYPKLY